MKFISRPLASGAAWLLVTVYFAGFPFLSSSGAPDEQRYYTKINFHNFTNFDDFKSAMLEETADGSLLTSTNIVLGVTSPECDHLLLSPAFRASQRYAGGDVLASASLPVSEMPFTIDNFHCAEVFYYPINTPLNEPKETTDQLDHQTLTAFIQTNIRIGLTYYNDFSFPIDVYWRDEAREATFQATMQPGDSHFVNTFLGHVFTAHMVSQNKDEPGLTLDFMVVKEANYHFNPANRGLTCESYAEDHQFIPNHCENMETRSEQFQNYVHHQKRLGLNYVQPKFVPAVTAEGFMHLRLPNETYRWLKAWYDEQQAKDIESSAGPCMNQAVAPSIITHLTPSLKDRLARELKPILHSWYGTHKGDIKMTSCYGIRKYTNGSVLRMHVDTVNTHVVSAIINVDQSVEKDWPLLILDHDDNEHNIVMQPGDMVLYESAKLLHGRPDPFIGASYDNIFIHYMPIEGWDYSWV